MPMTEHGECEAVHVLLVEDDPGDVLMTREAFEHNKMRNVLHVVTDGEQALQFLRRGGGYADAPRPGLILLDLNLPRRDGLEVLAELKADPVLKVIPVVILTTSQAHRTSCAAMPCMPTPTSASRWTLSASWRLSGRSTASSSPW